jgi:hypothetical protein
VEAYTWIAGRATAADTIKLRLYINAVQVAESAYLLGTPEVVALMATAQPPAGYRVVELKGHNYDTVNSQTLRLVGRGVFGATVVLGATT